MMDSKERTTPRLKPHLSFVRRGAFLADINDLAKMNEIYARHFAAPFPARSTVQAARLPRDAKIEIGTVAVAKNNSKNNTNRKGTESQRK